VGLSADGESHLVAVIGEEAAQVDRAICLPLRGAAKVKCMRADAATMSRLGPEKGL